MTIAQLALISLIALVGALVVLPRRFRVPVVVGELVAGVVFGASGLRVLDASNPTFSFLGNEVGFALVMFVAGSHVPLRSPGLRGGVRLGAIRAVAVGVLAVPAGLWLASLFGTHNGLLYAVVIASSSAAMILPSLGQANLSGAPVVAMLGQVAIADAACIVVLPLAVDPAAAPKKLLGVAATVAASLVVFLVLRWAERTGRRQRLHQVSERQRLALELRISLTLLFAVVALAQVLKVSPMLAGFAIGLAVAAVGEPHRLARQLFGLTEGFFGPLFFVWLGANLDLRGLASTPRLVVLGAALGLVAALVHGVMALGRQPWPLAVTTCAQLGVPVAAATIGRSEGMLAPGEDAALLLGALVTIAITTLVSGRVAAIADRTALPDVPGAQGPDAGAAGPSIRS